MKELIGIDLNAVFLLVLIIVIWFLFYTFRYQKDTIGKKSYWIKKSVFTPTEFKFYQALLWYMSQKWLHSEYTVFTKIRMIDIFYPSKKFNWKENQKMVFKILAKHIDFIITDKKGAPVLLIELDDKYHSWRKSYKADNLKNDISEYTGLKLLRFTASNYYDLKSLSEYL